MTVEVIDGEVVILGPDGMAASLTPDSAEESSRRLADAARRAREPRSFIDEDEDETEG
jgi:hypothetical protein